MNKGSKLMLTFWISVEHLILFLTEYSGQNVLHRVRQNHNVVGEHLANGWGSKAYSKSVPSSWWMVTSMVPQDSI